MQIDVVLNNAEVSFIRNFFKIKSILMQARRWASKPFLSEAPTSNVSPCWKRSKAKQSEISGRGQLSLLPSHQFSLANWIPVGMQSRKPPKPQACCCCYCLCISQNICFLFLNCQSKCSVSISGEHLTCRPNCLIPTCHLKPHLESFEVQQQEVVALPDVLRSLWHCAKMLCIFSDGWHSPWALLEMRRAGGTRGWASVPGHSLRFTVGTSCWSWTSFNTCHIMNCVKSWGKKIQWHGNVTDFDRHLETSTFRAQACSIRDSNFFIVCFLK